ncbi:MAG: hypothetical protein A2719_00205 [Candidatus Ryanbacteria bacterium RIFCSPHIGHO2_01_FULL_45_22]|uniref:Uncharacterized protein n=1 Tax=Candidatus Ryanbacteria bacterium RIFCSPHIGHO2_01_FULL_45_22 TaxID=1802114 RepID=A0A1G2G288_9BACT|nr:MAG: hypothetical protein A2719_00205 [Candidatus Ryanbacteria bacterium RIFCSPHIGHO2_01_FULL_45_22]
MKQYYGSNLREIYMYRHRPENKRIIADIYWRFLLFLAFIILLISIGYGIFGILAMDGEQRNVDGEIPVADSTTILDRAKLQGVIESMQERESRFETIKANRPAISDPSR